MESKLVLVTGATGYIGGRLVPKLLEMGYRVRVFVRDPARLRGRSWLGEVDVIEGDVLNADTLPKALDGVGTAYYLIHSMGGQSEAFHDRDVKAAKNFGSAAKEFKVEHIIYLGGLGNESGNLSEHLASRQETGKILAQSGVPVTEFRAAIIVGSGSISFEMIRYLTERLPVMVCPKWLYVRVQPIGIADVLSFLTGALTRQQSRGRIVEIGGKDVITYGDMIKIYASVRGLTRILIPVPVLTPLLSSYWVHWFSPVPASIVRPLIEGLRSEVVADRTLAKSIFPEIVPIGYRGAVEAALENLSAEGVESSWTDALSSSQGDNTPMTITTQEGMVIEQRNVEVNASPVQVFNTLLQLGGENGWLYMDWAWRLRGAFDRLVGGVGLRRGRRNQRELRIGDAMDFWRVEEIALGKKLRLRAEMKLPGKAWLEFDVEAASGSHSRLKQTAYFAPKGLFGFLYWNLLYPIHSIIFSGLIRRIKLISETINET